MSARSSVLWLLDWNGWLESYDPDGGDPAVTYPTGTFGVTSDPARALRFTDGASAMAFWRQPSARTPKRPDGKPNCPLTKFTVMVMPEPGRK